MHRYSFLLFFPSFLTDPWFFFRYPSFTRGHIFSGRKVNNDWLKPTMVDLSLPLPGLVSVWDKMWAYVKGLLGKASPANKEAYERAHSFFCLQNVALQTYYLWNDLAWQYQSGKIGSRYSALTSARDKWSPESCVELFIFVILKAYRVRVFCYLELKSY